MKALKQQNLTQEEFIKICNESSNINEAIRKTNLHRGTFTKYAKQLGCFKPNPGGKGIKKDIINPSALTKFNIEDWNNDIIIDISRSSLRNHIFNKKLLPIQCNKCKLTKWNELPIPLEINHINGNGYESKKSNIELLCPNCHAQTETYRGKNLIKKYGKKEVNLELKKQKEKEYRNKTKNQIKKSNKWHSFKRTKEEYLKEREKQLTKSRQELINQINQLKIDFTKSKWRKELSKILNLTPQYVGIFIKKYMPNLWNNAWHHNS